MVTLAATGCRAFIEAIFLFAGLANYGGASPGTRIPPFAVENGTGAALSSEELLGRADEDVPTGVRSERGRSRPGDRHTELALRPQDARTRAGGR
jgi:hypothetical protein